MLRGKVPSYLRGEGHLDGLAFDEMFTRRGEIMRLAMCCHQCAFGGEVSPDALYPVFIEVRDDGRYEFTCQKGHTSVVVLQQQKFEVLFQIGAYAILDGYYREAVASFTSSMERFYEFFIKAKLLQDERSENVIDAGWKLVSSQSERQLGAFIFLYLQTFGHEPTLLSTSKVSFRNDVIHKGKIPSRAEALAYGQAVLDVVRPIIDEMKQKFPEGLQTATFAHLMKTIPKPEAGQVSTMSVPTIVSLTVVPPNGQHRSLEDELKELDWWRAKWR